MRALGWKPNVPVVSIVFYHCRGMEGVRFRQYANEFYGRPTLGVGYWTVGIGEMDAQDAAEGSSPMGWALASWMRKPAQGRARLRMRLQEKILLDVEDERYREVLLETVRTRYRLNAAEKAEEERLIREEMARVAKERIMTEFEKLRMDGRRVGRQEGRQEALRQSVLDLLTDRFGQAPPPITESLKRIRDMRRLRSLIMTAYRCPSLEAFEESLQR